jgi:hypothetical protein
MDNWLANIVDDVDSLHVEIDNLNDPLVRFSFIRSIDMPSKTPSKTQWEKYKEKPYDICPYLYLYFLIKNLVWETLGKTHKGKKSTISVIGRSSTSYNLGFYSP